MLLVQLPFFRLDAPSLGLALLEAALVRAGMRCEVEHLNLEYGKRIGKELYAWIAGRAPRQLLLGDLVFAPCLHGTELDLDRVRALAARLEDRRDERVPRAVIDETPRLARSSRDFLEAIASRLHPEAFDLVGIGTFFNVVPALALAREIKRRSPSARVVLGGCNCEGELGEALVESFPFLDLVCQGEGEELIVELAERLRRGRDLAGIASLVWRDGRGRARTTPRGAASEALAHPDRAPLDRLPVPRFERWLADVRRLGVLAPEELQLPIETSRGCSHGQKRHCVFCGLNGEWIRFRRKSPARVLEELRAVMGHGVPVLHCVDNVLDRGLLRTVLPELARDNHGCQIFWEVRPDLDRSELELLARSGVTWLQAGIESLSSSVLRCMGKGTTALGNVRFLRYAAELGLGASWSVLFGLPDEDPDEYRAMAELMPALSHLQPPRLFQQVRVDRFSPLFVERRGLARVVPAASYAEVFRFEPETVARLAYFFEHDYDPPRDPHGYTASCADAVERWREEVGGAALIRFDGGGALRLVDTRALARRRTTILRGLDREVYLGAEHGASLEAIAEGAGEPLGEVSAIAERLVEDRHAVLLDGELLSLAVPVDDWVPSGAPAVMVEEALCEAYVRRMASLVRGYQTRESARS